MTDSPSLRLKEEAAPWVAKLSADFQELLDAMRPAMKAFVDMVNALTPMFDEKRARRAKVRALRADFIRKRGLRR